MVLQAKKGRHRSAVAGTGRVKTSSQNNGRYFGVARRLGVGGQVWIAVIIAGTPRMATSLLKL